MSALDCWAAAARVCRLRRPLPFRVFDRYAGRARPSLKPHATCGHAPSPARYR